MHPYMYEKQTKIKLDSRFKEAREWRMWRKAHPAGPGFAARVMVLIRSTGSRLMVTLRGRAANRVEPQATPAPEPKLDTVYSTHAH